MDLKYYTPLKDHLVVDFNSQPLLSRSSSFSLSERKTVFLFLYFYFRQNDTLMQRPRLHLFGKKICDRQPAWVRDRRRRRVCILVLVGCRIPPEAQSRYGRGSSTAVPEAAFLYSANSFSVSNT
jgi:hypothetical protein